ncbi:transposase [Streptomyces antarcticus]|uniref:transposase n=1 Tax=Streptomyces antarcticus TaxID=2996458 RepID=UPI003F673FFD
MAIQPPYTSPRQFGKLVTVLRRQGADAVRKGRPWSLPLEDRALLVAAYWRTNLTMRQLAPLFGVSKSAADRIIDHLGPMFALQPRKRFAKDSVLIVDGTLVPTRDHTVAAQSKNYRYSTNHQVVIDADTRLVVVVGRPLTGNRNDCKAWEESGAKAAFGQTLTIADGGYPGTGLVMPHRRRRRKGEELPEWKQEHSKSHKQVRARIEHVFARMKTWKILRDCRLKGDGVHHAMLGIARMHNLALAGQATSPTRGRPNPKRLRDHLRDNPKRITGETTPTWRGTY